MNDDEDELNHSHLNKLKPVVQERDDQRTTPSTINKSNVDTIFSKETRQLRSNQRRIHVKFANSFDNDRLLPITQTTVIRTEPCFKVIATEDPTAKDFYRNKPKEREKAQSIERKISIESDSLDEEDHTQSVKERETTLKSIDAKQPVLYRVPSSPIKSILKKPKKKEEKEQTSRPKLDRALKSRSFPSKKKDISSTRLDFNEVQHLAEITAKQNLSSPSVHVRSLFDQTINIFDPNDSYRITSNTARPSRLRYYIKPYRGEPEVSTNMHKQRSRSLPQQSGRITRCYTFSNHYARPSARQSDRKQHISWSPGRDYIHHGRDHTIVTPTKKKELSSDKTRFSSLPINPPLSLSSPCLRNFPPIKPVSVPYRTSSFPSPSLSSDSYHTPSIIDRPLPPLTPVSQYSYNEDEKQRMLRSQSPDIVHQHKKKHDETMRRYDRLLEKLHATDEQLRSLSRSWMNNTQQRTPVKVDRRSNLSLNKMTSDSHLVSPMIVQICLIILVIFNLLVVCFFNEINVWWSENLAPGMTVEQHNDHIFNF